MSTVSKIFLDNNATTGVDPRVLEAMLPCLSTMPANPSSAHYFGQEARNKLSRVRHEIAEFFQVKPTELIFTSGGTESLNMIFRGLFGFSPRGHIISSNVEHSSVFKTLQVLEKLGCKVTYLPAGLWGVVKPEAVQAAITSDTSLIALGAVNNETGVQCDIEAIAKIAENAHITFVVDAVALLGKEPFSIPNGVSAMAFSAHKLHGPKGIGLAFIRSSLKLQPLLTGGDQEYSKRAGTENLPGILGFAEAIKCLKEELPGASLHMQSLRERLEKGLKDNLQDVLINGQGPRICNTANLSFPGADGESLLISLDRAGIAVSHGSACSSGALEPSRILINMGLSQQQARSSIRFSLSRWTTEQEIDTCVNAVVEIVSRQKKLI